MNASDLKLPKPPIVEAVLDIDCDLPPGQQLAALEERARARYGEDYPRFRTVWMEKHHVEANPDQPTKVSVEQGIKAFHFLQEDEKQLIQMRVQGFAFNRLAPYTSLDDYLPEIEGAWKSYVDLASPVQIRRISLRYINRIVLPSKERCVTLDHYLRIGPRSPDQAKLRLVGFLNQQAAVEVGTGHQVNILLSSQPEEGEKLPIIFDNSATAEEAGRPEDWAWILGKIQALRDLKNRVFQNTLTEECLNLFR